MTMSEAEQIESYQKMVRGAEDDNVIEQLMLSMIYYTGTGAKKNNILAYKWVIIFESNHISTEAYKKLAKTIVDMVGKDMTPEDIAEAEKLAKEWIKINRDDWHENEIKKHQQDKT